MVCCRSKISSESYVSKWPDRVELDTSGPYWHYANLPPFRWITCLGSSSRWLEVCPSLQCPVYTGCSISSMTNSRIRRIGDDSSLKNQFFISLRALVKIFVVMLSGGFRRRIKLLDYLTSFLFAFCWYQLNVKPFVQIQEFMCMKKYSSELSSWIQATIRGHRGAEWRAKEW